jgi:hypothetical protein
MTYQEVNRAVTDADRHIPMAATCHACASLPSRKSLASCPAAGRFNDVLNVATRIGSDHISAVD